MRIEIEGDVLIEKISIVKNAKEYLLIGVTAVVIDARGNISLPVFIDDQVHY